MEPLVNYFPEYSDNKEVLSELVEYQRDLEILFSKSISIQFNNKGKNHAILVMSKIFETSYKRIKIFARDFNGDISDNPLYIESLRAFLNKANDTSVDVIFETSPNTKSKALELLRFFKSQNSEKVRIRKASELQIKELQNYLVNEEKMIHFAIGDDIVEGFNKYRCETDTKNYIAILNSDDKKFCDTLLKLFKIIEKDSIAIP